jgi:hypothetical protein
MAEVTTLGAIAVPVLTLVMLIFHRPVKPVFSFLDLITNLWEIRQFKRRAVLVDKIF